MQVTMTPAPPSPPKWLFPNSLLKREKFPVSREFRPIPLTLSLSPQTGRGNTLRCRASPSQDELEVAASLPLPVCGERAGVRGRRREEPEWVKVDGKIALVTGGASGIGEACVATLAREGAAVVISDIDDVRGNDLASSLGAAGHNSIYLRHDVTDEARWQEIVVEIERRYGRLDILVANAGIGIMVTSIAEMSLADWRRRPRSTSTVSSSRSNTACR